MWSWWCRILLVVLGVAWIVLLWLVMVPGTTRQADDGRVAVLLPADQRALVLMEMRAFLEAVQGIAEAAAAEDMAAVRAHALKVGVVDMRKVPPSLVARLPLELKKLGFATHAAFRQLAADAEAGMSGRRVMARLGDILLNCTMCHAGWRLDVAP